MSDLFHLPVGHLFSKAGSNAMFSPKRPNVTRYANLMMLRAIPLIILLQVVHRYQFSSFLESQRNHRCRHSRRLNCQWGVSWHSGSQRLKPKSDFK